jgi:hypothetical protein
LPEFYFLHFPFFSSFLLTTEFFFSSSSIS